MVSPRKGVLGYIVDLSGPMRAVEAAIDAVHEQRSLNFACQRCERHLADVERRS